LHLKERTQNKLGSWLREKRVTSGLSQAEVAQKLGYSTAQFISNWDEESAHLPWIKFRL